jgi:hypothetical protein
MCCSIWVLHKGVASVPKKSGFAAAGFKVMIAIRDEAFAPCQDVSWSRGSGGSPPPLPPRNFTRLPELASAHQADGARYLYRSCQNLAITPTAEIYRMNRSLAMLIASVGVFLGSLLSDVLLGDGVQAEDVQQAALVALIAAAIQWWLYRRRG